MARQRLILFLIAWFTLGVFAEGTLPRRRIPPTGPGPERLRGLTEDERTEALRKWFDDRKLQERTSTHEYISAMMKQALKNELRVDERHWRIIEPKYERQIQCMCDSWAYGSFLVKAGKSFDWRKSCDKGPLPKTAAELTEAERNVDKLIDLLRQQDTSDEELRKQIDALQQARERARQEWPKAKQELAATLTTPRQEAVFLLLGHID